MSRLHDDLKKLEAELNTVMNPGFGDSKAENRVSAGSAKAKATAKVKASASDAKQKESKQDELSDESKLSKYRAQLEHLRDKVVKPADDSWRLTFALEADIQELFQEDSQKGPSSLSTPSGSTAECLALRQQFTTLLRSANQLETHLEREEEKHTWGANLNDMEKKAREALEKIAGPHLSGDISVLS